MASSSPEENHSTTKAGYFRYDKPRFLIDVLDERARVCPHALFGEYTIFPINYSQGYRKITYAQLANAVNGAAKWLTEELGPAKDFQTLSYMGWNDFRYVIFILGAVKAGYKEGSYSFLLLTSPLLTASATTHLFTTMSCKVLLTTSSQPPTVAPVVKLHDYLRVLTIPSIEELLNTTYKYFPYEKKFEEAKGETLVALHTSRTTGLSKPVIYTHDYAAAYVRAMQLELPEGFESLDRKSEGGRVFSLTAPFHTSAICIMIAAIANQTTHIFPPAVTIPTAALAVEGLKHTNDVVGILGGRPLVVDCAKNSELLDFFAIHVGLMCYGCGDVAQALRRIVSTKLDLYTSHGSTESFRLHPEGENLYEACIVRNPKPEDEQPVFKLFPTLQEFRTKDLYSPHPTKPDLWIYKMRSDDMIPLSNGQIANPSIMEHAVLDCTGIKEAVVLPAQKICLENYITCIALLIEPTTEGLSNEQKDGLIGELWPIVAKTNSYYRTNAFIEKKRILFVDPRKPLARTAKGTVSSKSVLEDYKEEVDKLT
ncbi:putative nrps-like enzyme protein [Botrytis fragariae]|uniref:Putative nrps-like enzyme protein n=1 Tax=Botrytis fragariae TaxID=1964551 RepID=A0A8H6ENG0_9HELO|nr:putative nrps-like enzyme protein [Botrytis fragariae]KAF5878579.1 putative nrps-like enzyme protein [Botrytis fragariae]